MWVWLALASAFLLGFYDVAKKWALRRNGVLYVLLTATALSTLFLSPFLFKYPGTWPYHFRLMFKAVLVSASWISGLAGIKRLPLTTTSTIKASRPVFVVLFSLILFSERLNVTQWAGVVLVLMSVLLLGMASRREGIHFTRDRGVLYMLVSVFTGAASALYDKHIITGLHPLFIQSWSNFYITLVLLATVIFINFRSRGSVEPFRWDWTLLAVALIITVSDAFYFYSLSWEGSLLSVITLLRRSSVVITFIAGAILFKEHRIRDKAAVLAILMLGLVLLVLGSG